MFDCSDKAFVKMIHAHIIVSDDILTMIFEFHDVLKDEERVTFDLLEGADDSF